MTSLFKLLYRSVSYNNKGDHICADIGVIVSFVQLEIKIITHNELFLDHTELTKQIYEDKVDTQEKEWIWHKQVFTKIFNTNTKKSKELSYSITQAEKLVLLR